MNSDEVTSHARRVAALMIAASEPGAAMLEILDTYIETPAVSSTDMIKILASSAILISQSLNDTAMQSINVTAGLLALLYADKSPSQLAVIASRILAHDGEESGMPDIRVVLVRRHE